MEITPELITAVMAALIAILGWWTNNRASAKKSDIDSTNAAIDSLKKIISAQDAEIIELRTEVQVLRQENTRFRLLLIKAGINPEEHSGETPLPINKERYPRL